MATGYRIEVQWSEADQAYLAEVPALPGCIADGGTAQQARANAELIIREWLETARALGRPIPPPQESHEHGGTATDPTAPR